MKTWKLWYGGIRLSLRSTSSSSLLHGTGIFVTMPDENSDL